MRTAFLHGERDIRLAETPDPEVLTGPGSTGRDAVVRVVASCVCGSDLWGYRGVQRIDHPWGVGHEFIGVVESTPACRSASQHLVASRRPLSHQRKRPAKTAR